MKSMQLYEKVRSLVENDKTLNSLFSISFDVQKQTPYLVSLITGEVRYFKTLSGCKREMIYTIRDYLNWILKSKKNN